MKPKVLIIHPCVNPYRKCFFEELSKVIPIHLFLYFKTGAHRVSADEVVLGQQSSIEYCSDETPERWRPIGEFFRILPSILRTFWTQCPKIVVVTEYSPISLFCAIVSRLCRAKVVLWTDDSLMNAQEISRLRRAQRQVAFRLADRLIVINPVVAICYDQIFTGPVFTSLLLQPEASIRDALFSEETTQSAENLLEQYSLYGKKVLLFVGRLSPEKNLSFLLDTFAQLDVAVQEKMRLVLVGDGPQSKELKDVVTQLGIGDSVIFAGYRSRDQGLWAWFRLAGLFVLPSTYEPFGAVVNESLICGVPVLCSSRAGSSCLIQNEMTGIVFDPQKKNELTAIILEKFVGFELVEECFSAHRESLMIYNFTDTVHEFSVACGSW